MIVAGGAGSRLDSPVPKFEARLLGRPMVLYSLEAFERCGSIGSIILVVPRDRLSAWSEQAVRSQGISRISATVAGGGTRQESVYNGLLALEADDEIVVVHDAARPLVTPALIDAVAAVPEGAGGQTAAVPATDTLKRARDGNVAETLDRSGIVCAQTPQAFILEVLLDAHRRAVADGFIGTDDASLVERAGGTVAVAEGSRENMKITYASDIRCAEAILAGRKT